MKIVVNRRFGGFGLSHEAARELGLKIVTTQETYGSFTYIEGQYELKRDDPKLVAVVEKLGEAANGDHAELEVVDVPEKHWYIHEYDGLEHIVASDSPIKNY